MSNINPITDSGDVFAQIESLAREAQAMPGLRKSNAIRIASLGLKELGEIKSRGQKLGAPPAARIRGKTR
jgi:hypothetical protein